MNKRKILFYLLISIFITACGSGTDATQGADETSADLSKTFKWKMVTTWPANFPIFQQGAEKFADDVRTMSNGRLDIR
ncbi:MAG: ABC transporter substrate-binding protein, partial [Gammaproteobacteria bacterium]